MRRTARLAWTGVCAGAAIAVGSVSPLVAATTAWTVGSGAVVVVCPLTVGGSFEARTPALSGTLTLDPANPSAVDGALNVDLSTLDTGIALRNTHLRERYLEIGREGFDTAVLSGIALAGAGAAQAAGRVPFNARLALHGVTQRVNGMATISRSDGRLQVEASFPVSLPAFQIAKPRYLGVGVQDQVEVRVKFTAVETASADR